MVVKVLGPLETGTEPLSPRERTVLSALVVRIGSGVAPAELAEAWWGGTPPRTWEQQVRNAVAAIRARLGKDAVERVGWAYRLGIDPDAVDAVRFERLVSVARGHALRAEHDRAIDAYDRALGLWRGAPLQDVANWAPGVVEAMRLSEIRASAEEELLDSRLAAGEHRALIADAERLLREQPLREDRWSILALANYRADRQAEALALLRSARERLADELGIEPGPRLAGLELAMLRRDPGLDAPVPAVAADAGCPYPGLRAFAPDDADVFFGRDADIESVLERLVPGAVVTIAGASGTGKSSLLLAGILPRLRARGRSVEVIRPGTAGVSAVRRAIERAGILAIDQAEELLASSPGDLDEFGGIARSFLDGGGAILVTLRSDALDRMRAIAHVGDDIGRGVYLLGPLSDTAYRSAIEEPARTAGLRIEPGLVELAVRDAGDRSSTLPHLSHAMQETWNRREGATLTVEGYRLSGGIPGAIAQSAEDAFRALIPDDQAVCRSLMMRLIERAADGAATRRRVAAAPLLADSARRRVLERLTRARLVTVDQDAATVAHEAVATAWPRLDAWLEEDAEGARTMRAVEAAAAAWDAGGRQDDDLLRGARLHSALEWRDATPPDLTSGEAELITASENHEQRELRELNERAGRDRRRNRVLGAALAGSAVLLVAAVVAGGFAAVRGQEAAEAAENARVEAIVATSLSLRESDRAAAALLAAEAHRRWPDDGRVRSALLGVVTEAQGLLDTHHTEGAWQASVAAIPGTGTALRVRDSDTSTALEIIDVVTGDVERTLDVDVVVTGRWLANYRDVRVSADGSTAVVQSGTFVDDSSKCCWNQLTFIDLDEGRELTGSGLVKMRTSVDLELAADGSVAYIQHPILGALITVDTRTGEVRASDPAVFDDYSGQGGLYNAIAIVDDEHVATAVEDRVDVFDRHTLALERSISLPAAAGGRALVADGVGGLVSGGAEATARIDPATGELTWIRAARPSENCMTLNTAPQGGVLCGAIGRVVEIDPLTGSETGLTLATQRDETPLISVIDDRTVLVDGYEGQAWMRWRLDGTGAGIEMVARDQYVFDPPSPDGRLIPIQPIVGGPSHVWDLTTRATTGVTADGIAVLSDDVIEYYTEGEGFGLRNVTTGERYPYRIPDLPDDFGLTQGGWGPLAFVHVFGDRLVAFDPSTGEQVGADMRVPDALLDGVWTVSQSPDGERVAVTWFADAVGYAQTTVFRISDGDALVTGLPGRLGTVYLPSGELIAIAAETAERVDPATLQPRTTLPRADGSRVLMASDDGRTLMNVGARGHVRLYDLTRDIPLGDEIDGDTEWGVNAGYLLPDGTALLTNSSHGVLAWDLVPERQAQAACAIAGREFSAEEWETYFPGEERVATCAELGA